MQLRELFYPVCIAAVIVLSWLGYSETQAGSATDVVLKAGSTTHVNLQPCPCCNKPDCAAWAKYCASHKAAPLPVGCPVASQPTATSYKSTYHEEVASESGCSGRGGRQSFRDRRAERRERRGGCR